MLIGRVTEPETSIDEGGVGTIYATASKGVDLYRPRERYNLLYEVQYKNCVSHARPVHVLLASSTLILGLRLYLLEEGIIVSRREHSNVPIIVYRGLLVVYTRLSLHSSFVRGH